MMTIVFGNSCGTTNIYAVDSYDNIVASLQVFVTPGSSPLSEGSILTGSQLVQYNTIPASLNATSASGGNCYGQYQYQWQYSEDGEMFYDIELENNVSLLFDQYLTKTTYFRRKVVCGADSLYTGSVPVYVIPPFLGGVITSASQSISFHTAPATINASSATNCNVSIAYQWQLSKNGHLFTNISGATGQNLSYTTPLDSTTYFRRKALCGTEQAFTDVTVVVVKIPEVSIAPPPNGLDTLLSNIGIKIDSLFGIPSDSIANNRRATANEWTVLEEQANRTLLLEKINSTGFDAVDLATVDTMQAIDNTLQRLSAASAGGPGSDSSIITSPFIDDNLIQSYRSSGNYTGLDSIVSNAPDISLEEFASVMEQAIDSVPTLKTTAYIRSNLSMKEEVLYSNSGAASVPCNHSDEFESVVWTAGGNTVVGRSFIQFDLSKIPPGAVITKASLSLYAHLDPMNGNLIDAQYGNNAGYLQRITNNWLCGTSWNGQPATTTTNQVLLPQSTTTTQDYTNIDVTQLVKDMQVNGNYGLALKQVNESTPYHSMIFYGPKAAYLTKAPLLQIEFTITAVQDAPMAVQTGAQRTIPETLSILSRLRKAVINGTCHCWQGAGTSLQGNI